VVRVRVLYIRRPRLLEFRFIVNSINNTDSTDSTSTNTNRRHNSTTTTTTTHTNTLQS
jgi:hypothetical protein